MTDGEAAAPWWLELTAVAAGTLVAGVGLVGLVLALLGAYSEPLTLLLGLPASGVAILAVQRALRIGRAPAHLPSALVALALAALWVVFAAWAPAQHVLINRDPGSYTNTARWLSRDGSLEVDAAAGGLAVDDPALRFDSLAVYDTGDGRLQFQFNHLTSVVLAVAYDVGGHRAMFRLPALAAGAALLVLYCVAVRATRRPWLALLAPALFGATMPLLYVARDTFSEPFSLLLLWSSLLVGLVALRAGRAGAAAVAGVVLGASAATRIDALLFVTVAFPLLAVHVATGPPLATRWRTAGACVAGIGLGVLVGVLDLQLRSGGYSDLHGDQAGLLIALATGSLLASTGAVVLLRWWPVLRERLASLGRALAMPTALVVVAALLFAWWVRPEVQVMSQVEPQPLVAALQEMEGVPVDGSQIYGELTLRWMSWYLGPLALLLGIAGLGLIVHRTLRGRGRPSELAIGAVLLAGTVYFWEPIIVPDHPWASRRFVPAVLPALVLTATVALGWTRGQRRPSLQVRRAVVGAVAALAVLGAASATWPVRELREQQANLGVLLEACELAGPESTLVVVGTPMAGLLPQALRSWCGTPAASFVGEPDVETVERIRDRVAAQGRTLVWVAADPAALDMPGAQGDVLQTARVFDVRAPERTLLRVPGGYEPPRNGWGLSLRREP